MSGFSRRLSSLAAVEIPAAPPPTTTILPFAEEVAALAVPAPAAVANPAAAIIFTKWRLSIFPIDFNVSFISSWVSIVTGFLSGFPQFVSENQSDCRLCGTPPRSLFKNCLFKLFQKLIICLQKSAKYIVFQRSLEESAPIFNNIRLTFL